MDENVPLGSCRKRESSDSRGAGQTFTYRQARDVMVLGNSNISGILFSISPDGQRVLASVAASDEQTGHLDLVAGWSTTVEEE